jgi:hypothetical protein
MLCSLNWWCVWGGLYLIFGGLNNDIFSVCGEIDNCSITSM